MLTVYFCMISAKCTGTKILLRSEATSDKKTSGIFARIKKLLLPRVLNACDGILYSCEKNRRYFRQFGVPDRKLFPVLSSVDNDFFSRSIERTRARRGSERNRLNVGNDDLVFLFLAQMSPRKRPNDAIEGFRILSRSFSNSHLIVVGDGALLPRLKKDVAGAALKNVHFVGFKNASEIPTFLGISDVMLITSEYDPSPKALNEAMISGLPSIVSSAIGTAGDLLKHDRNGLIYPVGDTDQLGHYMKVLAADPQKRALFGKTAMENAATWSPKANAEGIVQALDYCFSGPES